MHCCLPLRASCGDEAFVVGRREVRTPITLSCGSRRSPTPRVHALGVGVLLTIGLAIAVASLRGSALRVGAAEKSDLAPVLFLALLVLALLLYGVALILVRRHQGRMGIAAICAIAAAIQFVPLAGPLLLSRDAYSYWAYGRIVGHYDGDPFTTSPARFPHDPATRAVARGWRRATSVYGTVFTYASAVVDRVARRSAENAALLFRALAAVAGVAATLFAATIARRKAFAAVFIGWNPIVALSFAGGGHNDSWMLALMLGALALIARKRDTAGGALWIVAAAVKAPAVGLLALHLVRSRRGVWLGAAAAALTVAIVSTIAFGTAWLSSLAAVDRREARYSIPARLEQLSVPERAAHVIAYAVLAAGLVWLAREARRGRTRLALGASLFLVASPWLLPWYSTWPVALASIDDDEVGQVVALVLAVYLLPSRIPF